MKNIYIITNIINGKQYVGKTKQPIELRLEQHRYCNANTKIHNAIIEFGYNNFKIELLEKVNDNIALEKEKFYTNKYNTKFPNGYNEMVGQSLDGGNNKMKGKHLPKSWKLNCSRPGTQNGMAKIYEIKFLDTNEIVRVYLRKGISEYLGISLATVKKWLNKVHIDHNTGRPIIFYPIGGIRNGK